MTMTVFKTLKKYYNVIVLNHNKSAEFRADILSKITISISFFGGSWLFLFSEEKLVITSNDFSSNDSLIIYKGATLVVSICLDFIFSPEYLNYEL